MKPTSKQPSKLSALLKSREGDNVSPATPDAGPAMTEGPQSLPTDGAPPLGDKTSTDGTQILEVPEAPAVTRTHGFGKWDEPVFLRVPPPASPAPNRFSTATLLHGKLRRWKTALRRRWWVFSLIFLLLGGPAIFLAIKGKPTYQSEAILWLAGKVTFLETGAGDRLFLPEDASYMGTQAALIKSHAIQARAFEKVRAAFPEVAANVTNADLDRIPIKLTVESSPRTSVLDLKAEGAYPEATRAFLDALMGEFFAVKDDYFKRSSAGALSSITDQMHEAEKQIKLEQNEMTRFQMSNNVPYLTEHGLSAGSQLATLTQVLSDLGTEHHLLDLISPDEFKDLAKETQYSFSGSPVPGEKASRALAANDNWAANTAYYQALQQLELLKAQRDEFSRVLRPAHSRMVKLNQQIDGLEQFVKTLKGEEGQKALVQMESRKKSLELQIQNLESQFRVLQTNAAEASRKLTEFDQIKQDLQRSQALYDRLLSLLQTVDLNHEMDQESLTPLGPASVALPTASRYKMPVFLLFVAIAAAFGVTMLLEMLDDRFSSPSEPPLVLPGEIVGQIPESRLPACNGTPVVGPLDVEPAFVEAFRNLRTSLQLMDFAGADVPRIIVVTSAAPKEGKTTVAVNLAGGLASAGTRVLLVDADFRRCSIHRHFGIQSKPGLLDVLNKKVQASKAIVSTAQPSLFVMPAGDYGDTSPDFLLRQRMGALLGHLATRYDYIVLDTAPVLATDEAASLGPLVHGVFLVVRNYYTSSSAAQEAARRLRLCNMKILGIVYNRADPSTDYYSRYSQEYYDNGRRIGGVAGRLAG